MPDKVCGEITYPFPNFNNATIEVCEWISNFISHFMINVIPHIQNHNILEQRFF